MDHQEQEVEKCGDDGYHVDHQEEVMVGMHLNDEACADHQRRSLTIRIGSWVCTVMQRLTTMIQSRFHTGSSISGYSEDRSSPMTE